MRRRCDRCRQVKEDVVRSKLRSPGVKVTAPCGCNWYCQSCRDELVAWYNREHPRS